jgi:hypothetical protein
MTMNHMNGPAQEHQEPTDHAATPARLLADWREAVAKEIAALEVANAAPSDQAAGRAYEDALTRCRTLAREAWARPVAGPADLRMRAEIAQHCLWSNYYEVDGTRRFEAVLSGQPAENRMDLGPFDERAVAELVKAVMWSTALWSAAAVAAPAADAHDAEADDDDAATIAKGRAADVATLIQRAKAGLSTLGTLWDVNASRAQMQFAVCSLECLLDDIADLAAPPDEAAPPA